MNEIETIEKIRANRDARAVLESEGAVLSKGLRLASKETDDAIRANYQQAVEEALAAWEPDAAALTEAKARKLAIEAGWKAGDRSVSAEEAAVVDLSIKRLTGLERSGHRKLLDTRSDLEPFLSDNHAAYYAADVLEKVTDVPVLVHKRPEDAPDISPAVILSQTEPTKGYGTFTPSGKVAVTLVGEFDIDWRIIQQAFDDLGAESTAARWGINLDNMVFDKPILFEPDQSVISAFAENFTQVWWSHVRQRGYVVEDPNEVKYRVRGSGYAQVISTDITHDTQGAVTGTAKIALGIGDVPHLGKEDFESDIADSLGYYDLGDYTAAGVITRYELRDLSRSWDMYFEHDLGLLDAQPVTYIATIEMHAEFEPVVVAD
jgi:hypothetical protein